MPLTAEERECAWIARSIYKAKTEKTKALRRKNAPWLAIRLSAILPRYDAVDCYAVAEEKAIADIRAEKD